MKKSRYNYFFEHDGVKLAFNSMSCALAEIDNRFERLYDSIETVYREDLGAEERNLLDDMMAGLYVVSDDTDELDRIKFRNYQGKYSTDSCSLVIAPTMACNFGCTYCYESPKTGMIREEVQEKLVAIVRENAEKKRNVDITWYGGEPLLAKKVIYALSERFIEICDKNQVEYFAGIITNGYLLTKEDVELFEKYRIRSVQITVDGPEEIHNRRRFLKKDPEKGTFRRIMENIRLLYDTETEICLRINIDRNNIQSTKDLILELKRMGLEKLYINFGHVAAYTEANNGIKDSCLTMFEYSQESLRLQEFLHQNGFTASGFPYYPGIKTNYCGADSINTFVIDPEGYKYKCWNEVGVPAMSVGNILWNTDEYTDEMISREVSYMTWSPFEDEECRECFLLPICMGGCPYSGKQKGKAQCERWKFNLSDVLAKTYDQRAGE